MAERQKFGFDYQKYFCQKNNLEEDKKYTGKFDAYKNGVFYQIKTYKNQGELMMADPFRYIENEVDFVLVVANRNERNEILSERKVLIKNNKLQTFLKTQDFNFRVHYCQELLNSVSNDESDDVYFKEHMKTEQEARKNSIINVQAKRDHKKQKRVQWSIPNRYIIDFLNNFDKIN